MSGIDWFSYHLGAADCFCEMVRGGVKQMALSHPCDTKEERDSFLPEFEKLCQVYGVKMYCEDDSFLTDLFPLSLNRDRFLVVFYREDRVLQEYLDLKEEKKKAQRENSYTQEKRYDIAFRFGKLLSYTEESIKRLLEENREKE